MSNWAERCSAVQT